MTIKMNDSHIISITQKDKYVLLSPQEFKIADVKRTENIEILSFVNFLFPQVGVEKAYYLLHQAMEEGDKVALAKFVQKTRF